MGVVGRLYARLAEQIMEDPSTLAASLSMRRVLVDAVALLDSSASLLGDTRKHKPMRRNLQNCIYRSIAKPKIYSN